MSNENIHEETARLLDEIHPLAIDPKTAAAHFIQTSKKLAAHLAVLDEALKTCEEELVSLDLSTKERCERLVEQRNEAEGELATLRAELARVKGERADKQRELDVKHGVIAGLRNAVALNERIIAVNDYALTALRVLCAKQGEALTKIRDGDSPYRDFDYVTAKDALALTSDSSEIAGMVLVEAKELAELRDDRKELERLLSVETPLPVSQAAIDAARTGSRTP
jgi:hypothetical protein